MILAITGLPGSGKSLATKYVQEKTGWPQVYFGGITIDEVKNRNLPVNEENERLVREELRKKHGMQAYALLSLPKIKQLKKENNHVIIDGLYSWEEFLFLKDEFQDELVIVAIHSSFKTRANRLAKRETRPLNEKELHERDRAEIENLHKAGPIARADIMIVNEASLDEFYNELDQLVQKN